MCVLQATRGCCAKAYAICHAAATSDIIKFDPLFSIANSEQISTNFLQKVGLFHNHIERNISTKDHNILLLSSYNLYILSTILEIYSHHSNLIQAQELFNRHKKFLLILHKYPLQHTII